MNLRSNRKVESAARLLADKGLVTGLKVGAPLVWATMRRALIARLLFRHYGELRRIRSRYMHLMEDCLTGSIYQYPPLKVLGDASFDATLRDYGWDWPSVAHSMIGRKRMANLRMLAERILFDRVPGDFIETGVWRGGACIYLRAILDAYKVSNRRVWAADSFKGLPPPNPDAYPADKGDEFHTYSELAVSLDEVKRNFDRYGLLDGQVVFLEGWFKDTLPTANTGPLAMLRMDGDMYESTTDALVHLYDRVSIGGYVVVDDYRVVEGCRQAVDDYRAARGISSGLIEIDGVGVYWQKVAR